MIEGSEPFVTEATALPSVNSAGLITKANIPFCGSSVYRRWSSSPSKVSISSLPLFHTRNLVATSFGRLNLLCDAPGSPIADDKLNPPYVRNIYTHHVSNNLLRPSSLRSEAVDELCILLVGWSPFEWGHFVTDFFPRLLMCADYSRRHGPFPLYISRLTPDYILSAIQLVSSGSFSSIRFFEDQCHTSFSHAVVFPYAQYLSDGFQGYHPSIAKLAEEFLQGFSSPQIEEGSASSPAAPGSRIFVSRKHDSTYKPLNPSRQIVNEDEVIDVLKSYGFIALRMEDYDLEGKIRLLSNVDILMGGWGSGLLNSFFSASKPRVVSLGYGFNTSQVNISTLMGQDHYELPTFARDDRTSVIRNISATPQHVSIPALAYFLAELLNDRSSR